MNSLCQQKKDKIILLFNAGEGNRFIHRECGVHTATVRRYREIIQREIGKVFRCKCGLPSGHQGWCSFRFSRSDRRQQFMASWVPKRTYIRKTLPPILQYPYVKPNTTGDDLVIRIWRMIPDSLCYDLKSDVCQEVLLRLVRQDFNETDVKMFLPEIIKEQRRLTEKRFQDISLHSVSLTTEKELIDSMAWNPTHPLSGDYLPGDYRVRIPIKEW